MATEQEKIVNRERVWSMVAMALTKGVWDMVEDSAATLTPKLGLQILEMIEKQLNLNVKAGTPEDVIKEIGKIAVEGMGFAAEAQVETGEKIIKLTLKNAEATEQFAQLQEQGVKKLFSHPFLCCGIAALAKIGTIARGEIMVDAVSKTTTLTFVLM